ncbi:Asp_protease domain-containing protein [Cucumis melo var. makuwa]|uniref:Asp_protease domain-containing protein n=1 Tax=Cucumis melo var. makuwa TaxID=1194695 RepID=A0A5A7SJQ1_CUCMM|nr:Asp_protease domain-containing protein [Cucumis melo var. makuwa]
MINLGGWNGPVDFMVLKMDDFNVVFGMEFLLEHHVIPMPSAKCLMITGSFLTMGDDPQRHLVCAKEVWWCDAKDLAQILVVVFQDYIDNSVVVYLDEIVARNPIREEPKEHLQKVAFDEARHDRGVILGVVDTTKPFEVETERFSRNNPQVYRFAEEWKQMIDIARACLEKASRQMEKRASQKRCPLSFQQRIKFPITGATMFLEAEDQRVPASLIDRDINRLGGENVTGMLI